jgi:hypothetical protein
MMRPMPIPIAPPIRVPSSQTSTLCAQPSACSSARVRSSVSVLPHYLSPPRPRGPPSPRALRPLPRAALPYCMVASFMQLWRNAVELKLVLVRSCPGPGRRAGGRETGFRHARLRSTGA